jgi:outer membrane protein assembly factor BamD
MKANNLLIYTWILTVFLVFNNIPITYAQGLTSNTSNASSKSNTSYLDTEKDLISKLESKSPKEIFNKAEQAFNEKEDDVALKTYRALNSLHPANEYKEKARLQIVKLYYRMPNMEQVVEEADKFIKFYPKSQYLEETSYLRAKAHFYRRHTLFNICSALLDWLKVDFSERDVGHLPQAILEFQDFLRRFPNGSYKEKAVKYLHKSYHLLAQNELYTIRFYAEKGLYLAAYNRSIEFIQRYADLSEAKEVQVLHDEMKRQLGLSD